MPTFEHNHIRFFYDDNGSGVPIVFIHPPGMGRKVFYHQYALTKHARLLMIDLSGHGDTIGVTNKVSIQAFADEIVALLNHLSIERAIICGYSSGGCIAQQFAITYQDRTIALILSGGFPKVNSFILHMEHLLGMYFIKKFPKIMMKTIAASHTTVPRLKRMLYHHMKKADRKTWYQFYKRSLHFSVVNKLQMLDIPILLIYGSKDLTNQHVNIYRTFIHAQEIFIKNAHHQLPFKNADDFNKIITQFLQSKQIRAKQIQKS